ncbi:nucleoside recognition domain-containing protein [Pelotalea chapellei]|uniref:Nucleoside recognition family protein n=1 Tax=Pelotalea chapellei TaxID=44671 RepID=A0ABS5UB49_9BACT|nr:nucleoside recognition domain-containing protein [Pelotalea chapellei]MBT1072905.1 nucleoside recognition family protein [Pelotalea chapellei]
MEDLVKIMLASGKAGLDLAFYVLLPVLVIMMAIMKVMEARGILALVARTVQPLLRLFGIPGAGAFAIVQMLLVSFAAPLATFSIMEKDGTSKRQIAATLAMVLTLSQANVVFPMVAVGLNLGVIMLTSIVGGLAAAAATYYLFARSVDDTGHTEVALQPVQEKARKTTILNLMIVGGQEAVKVILDTIPMLILAIFLVNILKTTGAIALLETILTPLFHLIGFPAVAVLPLATKYLAGGTAMMGVTINLLKEGAITTQELNRMAGFMTNPCDLVGVAVLISAGQRCASVARPAIAGFVVGLLIRGVLHLLLF